MLLVVTLDMLVLNSGEWLLSAELAASPWYVLIYRQRGEPRNELHLWLPRQDAPRSERYACKRYWLDDSVRWCIEIPHRPETEAMEPARARLRFTAPDGRVLWARHADARGLADLSDRELGRLLLGATTGSFSGI
jgi:hypothetical protein